MEILSHASVKKKTVYGFQISHFYWPFSSDIIAVEGLKASSQETPPAKTTQTAQK